MKVSDRKMRGELVQVGFLPAPSVFYCCLLGCKRIGKIIKQCLLLLDGNYPFQNMSNYTVSFI